MGDPAPVVGFSFYEVALTVPDLMYREVGI